MAANGTNPAHVRKSDGLALESNMKSIIQYIKSLRLCAAQCFNAHQVTQHQHPWLAEAVKQERDAYDNLPRLAKAILGKLA